MKINIGTMSELYFFIKEDTLRYQQSSYQELTVHETSL